MALHDLIDSSGEGIARDRVSAFLAEVGGDGIRPGDPLYEAARHTWNASVDKHPGLSLRCAGTADVVRGASRKICLTKRCTNGRSHLAKSILS